MVDLRGNVQTRLRKMSEGEADVTILAAAGLRRLGLRAATQAVPLHPVHELIPAPAQGALAVDVRFGDTLAERLVQPLGDHETTLAVQAEREILAGLRGGCSLPLGCYVWRYRSLWRAAARLDPGLDPSREPAQNLDQKPDQILGLAKANAASARVVHYAGAYGTLVDTVLADLQAP
jgi:porphobilinogen deaminase